MKIEKLNSKDKKAILMPEVLKIIIAVLCIALLGYLAVRLYSIFNAQSEQQMVSANLDAITQKITAISDGDALDYIVLGMKGKYYLISYDASVVAEDSLNRKMPKSCSGQSCLCICPYNSDLEQEGAGGQQGPWIINFFYYPVLGSGQKHFDFSKCESEGVCKIMTKKVNIDHLIFYENGVTNVNWISFYLLPKRLYFSSANGIVNISNYGGNNALLLKLYSDPQFKGTVNALFNQCKNSPDAFKLTKDAADGLIKTFLSNEVSKDKNLDVKIGVFSADSSGNVIDALSESSAPLLSLPPLGGYAIDDMIQICGGAGKDFNAYIYVKRAVTSDELNLRNS